MDSDSPFTAALSHAEDALAKLSNALYDVYDAPNDPSGNFQWADNAIDKMLYDLDQIRRWIEG